MGDGYNANDIQRAIDSGDKSGASNEINFDYMHMSPDQFSQVMKEMQGQCNAESDGSHHVTVQTDDSGNVTHIDLNDGPLQGIGINWFDTKLFDKNDYQGNTQALENTFNPTDPFGSIKRVLGGLLGR